MRESLQFAGAHLATSLVSFNVGVELGQLFVLALAVPVALAAAFLGGCTRETDHETGTLNTQYEDVDVRSGFSAVADTDLSG